MVKNPIARPRLIANLPTPVERLKSVPDAWVKRDDLTHAEIGGSKARKLEFLVDELVGRRVLAYAPRGSNWLKGLAWASEAFGFTVDYWVLPQHLNPEAARNWQKLRVRRVTRFYDYPDLFAQLLWRAPAALRRARLTPLAGTNARTTLAYVNAAFELRAQVDAGLLPEPEAIYVAHGTGGTAAGLLAGTLLAGLRSRVVAVRITTGLIANRRRVLALARAAMDLVEPGRAIDESRLVNVHDFAGTYAEPIPASRAAKRRFAVEEALALDDSYTAKTAAALLAMPARGPRLFWHTFGGR